MNANIKFQIKNLILFMSCLIYFTNFRTCLAQLPLITDNTGVQGKNNGQFEISNGVGFHTEHRCIENSSEISTVFTYGLNNSTDAVVGYPFLFSTILNDSSETKSVGFSDLSFEVKYKFLQYKSLSLALKPGITFPTGNHNEGLGSGKISETLFLITTAEFSSFIINGNLGYLRNENKCGDALNIWHISADIDYKLSDDFHLVVNSGIEKNPDKTDKTNQFFGLAGLYYSINNKCEVSIGYNRDFKKTEINHGFIYGLTIRF
jgi:hypothetical protein